MRKTDILDVAAGKLSPFMFLFGLYLVSYGDVSPGGGFQGGVVIASGVILLAIGRGATTAEARFPLRRLVLTEALSFALFVVVGLAGLIAGLGFLADVLGPAGPEPLLPQARFIFVLNVLVGLKVAAGAALICLYLFGDESARAEED